MILFRCDASPQIGFGHLMRCRALAKELRAQGATCAILGPSEEYCLPEDAKTFSIWEPVHNWASEKDDAEHCAALARKLGASFAVLDDYRVGEDYQLTFRKAGLRWMQFEARTDRGIYADIVLNASPSASKEAYNAALKSRHTQLFLGPSYAIVRPEFLNNRSASIEKNVTNVLITFGAGDDRGALDRVLSVLTSSTPDDIQLTVVSGRHNSKNSKLKQWMKSEYRHRINIQIDPPAMADVMSSCQVAIMAGGTTTFECAILGIPMVLISIATNQIKQAQGWQKLGAAIYLGALSHVKDERIIQAFFELLDRRKRLAMAVAARNAVASGGQSVVAAAIIRATQDQL
jgi:UDP-2,4-diacetamido-2,4,6-trideoxy-beta-L-altropyranose hydrolase